MPKSAATKKPIEPKKTPVAPPLKLIKTKSPVPPATATYIEQTMDEIIRIQAEHSKLEKKLKQARALLLEAFKQTKIDKYKYGKYCATRINGSNSRLSPEKLVELGVSADIVHKSMVTTEFSYVKILGAKGL